MKRREFLIGAAAAAGLTRTNIRARTREQPKGDAAKLSRVAIMSLSFNSILKNPSQPDAPGRTLEAVQVVARREQAPVHRPDRLVHAVTVEESAIQH